MKADFEEKYHSLEEKHWWFIARREIILKLLGKIAPQRKGVKILEIGCSGGPLIESLVAEGYRDTYGIDVSKEAVQRCREKGLGNVVKMDGAETSFDDEAFDVIIASDVLEHIRDDGTAVAEWKRIVKRGGFLICFVPAFSLLWSKHDESNEHYRRYTKGGLERLFRRNKFSIIRASYWDTTLFFPVLLYRLVLRGACLGTLSANQLNAANHLLNVCLTGLLRIENSLLSRGVNFPFGISVFVIAQRAQGDNSEG